MAELVRVETDGGVATIRLDRPPMNAINSEVQEALRAAAGTVTADPATRSSLNARTTVQASHSVSAR